MSEILCPSCSRALEHGAKVCRYCGATVRKNPGVLSLVILVLVGVGIISAAVLQLIHRA